MSKITVLSLSVLAFMLTACGDNIRPESDSFGDDDGECFGESCPTDIDQPDGGTTTPDGGDTGEGPDAGTVGGGDAGTDTGTDAGTDTGTDGGSGGGDAGTDGGSGGDCGTCPEGQVCVHGACVCDHDGHVEDGGCAHDEVKLCHVPPGNPSASHGICVGPSAVTAHQSHGDTLGDCP